VRRLVKDGEHDDVAARLGLPAEAGSEPTHAQAPRQHTEGPRAWVEPRQLAAVLADDPKLEWLLESDAVALGFAREELFRGGELGRAQAFDEAPRGGAIVARDGVDVDPQRRVPIRRVPRGEELPDGDEHEHVEQDRDT
jgi:hypothetical protein